MGRLGRDDRSLAQTRKNFLVNFQVSPGNYAWMVALAHHGGGALRTRMLLLDPSGNRSSKPLPIIFGKKFCAGHAVRDGHNSTEARAKKFQVPRQRLGHDIAERLLGWEMHKAR